MYQGLRREQWLHTANVMTLLANCHRDPRRMRRPFHLADFLPADLRTRVQRAGGIPLTPQNLRLLKPLFTKD